MSSHAVQDRLSNHTHRAVILISYLLILIISLRRRYDLAAPYTYNMVLILMLIFAVLFTSEPFISRRIKWYPQIYFLLQIILIEFLATFQDYQDTWAWLSIVLGLEIATHFAHKEAMVWYSLLSVLLVATLTYEFGLISALGRAMAYGIMGLLVISTDIQYASHEDSLAESQMLVAELQDANKKLAEYAAQAKELAVLQERNRMIQELYDSVGQKIFAIQLAAEASRLMLDTNPQRAADLIDDLQEQTQSTLGQMRQLIDQWRPA